MAFLWYILSMKINTDPKKIEEILSQGVEEIINKEHLRSALSSGKQLRVKLGIDPTAPDLHLGHAVPLRKLRQFQNAGHVAVLIIGDFTARIGDPSGRTEVRKPLTPKEIEKNLKNYLAQAGKILDIKKTEIRRNSEWLDKPGLLIELAQIGTVQQVMRRSDFKNRLDAGLDVFIIEAFYPLMQGYDSVAVKADIELGGIDQKLNLLMGRKVQRHFGLSEQDVMMFPFLEGLDGKKKMSKSYGNYIGLNDLPAEMFGKTMSEPDNLITKYFTLCTDLSPEKNTNPYYAKILLAHEIVKIYHGEKAAQEAQKSFTKTFQKKEIPEDLPEIIAQKGEFLSDILVREKIVKSKSDFGRLIEEGAITNLETLEKPQAKGYKLQTSLILRVGKKRFVKIVV